jgi:hypothetical protein
VPDAIFPGASDEIDSSQLRIFSSVSGVSSPLRPWDLRTTSSSTKIGARVRKAKAMASEGRESKTTSSSPRRQWMAA